MPQGLSGITCIRGFDSALCLGVAGETESGIPSRPAEESSKSCGRVCPFHMLWKGLRDRPPRRSQFRNVAQLGSALGWGPRGRGFKSHHSDALIPSVRLRPFREDLIAL